MRKTIRNVTIVVPVLMTSCQVSEKWKNGPVIAHTTTVPSASAKTQARPTSREVAFATSANNLFGVRAFLDGGTRIGILEPFLRSEVLGTVWFQRLFHLRLFNAHPAGEVPDSSHFRSCRPDTREKASPPSTHRTWDPVPEEDKALLHGGQKLGSVRRSVRDKARKDHEFSDQR